MGLEYDFLACDPAGQVAFLSTAGGGYAPAGLLENPDLHESGIQEILARDPTTDGRCTAVAASGFLNEWRKMMRRGLYAYDSDFHGGPYVRCAVPRLARSLNELPPKAREAALTVRVEVEFWQARTIDDVHLA